MTTRLLIIAITPALALAFAVYLQDRYEREPMGLLVKILLFGALSVIPTIIVERFLYGINIFGGLLGAAYMAFIVAGLTEEYFKRAVVLRYAFNDANFNEKLDGIVYAVFAAIGFATVENVMYVVFQFSGNYYVGIYRGLLSVPAHFLLGVTMGYYISLAKYALTAVEREHFLRKAWLIPAILHGLFDFILLSRLPILGVLLIPFMIYLWVSSLRKLNQYVRESRAANREPQPQG